MKNLKLILAIFTVSVMIASCEKDGPQGPQGPIGTVGDKGDKGDTGNANVTSYLFSITNPVWSHTAGSNVWYYYDASHPIQEASTCAVMVYIKDLGGNWVSMPITNWFATDDNFIYRHNTGGIEYDYYGPSRPANTTYFKVVVIPPARLSQNPGINLNNYEEVKRAFGLKD